jgi:hypothetical protein
MIGERFLYDCYLWFWSGSGGAVGEWRLCEWRCREKYGTERQLLGGIEKVTDVKSRNGICERGRLNSAYRRTSMASKHQQGRTNNSEAL